MPVLSALASRPFWASKIWTPNLTRDSIEGKIEGPSLHSYTSVEQPTWSASVLTSGAHCKYFAKESNTSGTALGAVRWQWKVLQLCAGAPASLQEQARAQSRAALLAGCEWSAEVCRWAVNAVCIVTKCGSLSGEVLRPFTKERLRVGVVCR